MKCLKVNEHKNDLKSSPNQVYELHDKNFWIFLTIAPLLRKGAGDC